MNNTTTTLANNTYHGKPLEGLGLEKNCEFVGRQLLGNDSSKTAEICTRYLI